MGRVCTICRHPEKAEINRLLVEGTPFRKLVERFGSSPAALSRHRKDHIPAALVRAREAAEADRGLDLFAQIMDLNERTLRILGRAEASNDPRLALSAIKEARGNAELLCKVICSQMPQQARAGSGGYLGNGYQSDHAAPEEKRPDLSFLTDEEFTQLRELLRRADERERESLANEQLREGPPN